MLGGLFTGATALALLKNLGRNALPIIIAAFVTYLAFSFLKHQREDAARDTMQRVELQRAAARQETRADQALAQKAGEAVARDLVVKIETETAEAQQIREVIRYETKIAEPAVRDTRASERMREASNRAVAAANRAASAASARHGDEPTGAANPVK